MEDDWRLTGQETYLQGATLVRKPYRAKGAASEHDHCAFCWAKFVDTSFSDAHAAMARDDSAVQTEGYAAVGTGPGGQGDYHWVCVACFNDFRERFEWTVVVQRTP